MAEDRKTPNDPLIEFMKTNVVMTKGFRKELASLATAKTIAGIDVTFLADYSPQDKLPDYIVAYVEHEVKSPSHLAPWDIESKFRILVATIGFVETGNLNFLRLAIELNDTYVLGRITTFSPLYEQYLLEEIEHKVSELTTFLSQKRDQDSSETSYRIVGHIDMLLYSAILYKKALRDSNSPEQLTFESPFNSDYLFAIFVFAHNDLFFGNFDIKHWQNFATKINDDCTSIFDKTFCFGGFYRISEIFSLEFQNTRYAELMKRMIGGDKQWNNFLICCQNAQKAYVKFTVMQKETLAKLKTQQKMKHGEPKSPSTDKDKTKTE